MSEAPIAARESRLRRAVGTLDRHLWAVAVLASAALFVPGVVIGSGWSDATPSVVGGLVLLILTFLVGYRIEQVVVSLAVMVTLAFGATAGELSGSVVSMWVFSVPAWVIGRVMRSRSRLSVKLAQRADELEAEREAYAHESVRYERARIARDLHDVVAHNLSMIVVQAAAGRRALPSDPAIAFESLRHIQGGAQRAELEIAQLVELLGEDGPALGDDLSRLDELVRQAANAGLSVGYSFSGSRERIAPEVGEVALRVAQEGITNALKHATGAAIRVEVQASAHGLSLAVENGAPHEPHPGLRDVGGGYGIAGMRDRVTALGGTLETGPTEAGGWRLAVGLPVARPR